jgi:hypothetical protein
MSSPEGRLINSRYDACQLGGLRGEFFVAKSPAYHDIAELIFMSLQSVQIEIDNVLQRFPAGYVSG